MVALLNFCLFVEVVVWIGGAPLDIWGNSKGVGGWLYDFFKP
jgi:hypothetical protein